MKTKALLFAGILLGTSIASSFAQVYSVNAVGYVSVTLAPGEFKIVCNPLNVVTNGVQNNSLDSILPTAPNNVTRIYKFDVGTQSFLPAFTKRSAGWNPGPLTTGASPTIINPGEGFFVQNAGSTNITLTFVGEVPQGTNLTINLVNGFQLVSPHVPVAGLVQTDLGIPASNGDKIYVYRSGAYTTFTRRTSTWLTPPGEPSMSVGEGFYFQSVANKTWTKSFTTGI